MVNYIGSKLFYSVTHMSKNKIEYGQFSTGLDYISIGESEQVVLLFLGGPGNDLPKGVELKIYIKSFAPIIKNYKLYFISRKSGLPQEYTTEQMAGDYASIISTEFAGKVHGVIGLSFGGMIMQHFCALYPNLAEKFIILSSAHKISEKGRLLDQKFAELLSIGKNGAAYALISEAIFPKGIKRMLFKPIMRLMGIFRRKHLSNSFAQDVLIEVQAELNHDVKKNLGNIKVPVTIVCGDQDYYFPIEYLKEMCDLIPETKLKIIHGKGHDAFEDTQTISYILKELQAT